MYLRTASDATPCSGGKTIACNLDGGASTQRPQSDIGTVPPRLKGASIATDLSPSQARPPTVHTCEMRVASWVQVADMHVLLALAARSGPVTPRQSKLTDVNKQRFRVSACQSQSTSAAHTAHTAHTAHADISPDQLRAVSAPSLAPGHFTILTSLLSVSVLDGITVSRDMDIRPCPLRAAVCGLQSAACDPQPATNDPRSATCTDKKPVVRSHPCPSRSRHPTHTHAPSHRSIASCESFASIHSLVYFVLLRCSLSFASLVMLRCALPGSLCFVRALLLLRFALRQ